MLITITAPQTLFVILETKVQKFIITRLVVRIASAYIFCINTYATCTPNNFLSISLRSNKNNYWCTFTPEQIPVFSVDGCTRRVSFNAIRNLCSAREGHWWFSTHAVLKGSEAAVFISLSVPTHLA